jgi:hypothetical protein
LSISIGTASAEDEIIDLQERNIVSLIQLLKKVSLGTPTEDVALIFYCSDNCLVYFGPARQRGTCASPCDFCWQKGFNGEHCMSFLAYGRLQKKNIYGSQFGLQLVFLVYCLSASIP